MDDIEDRAAQLEREGISKFGEAEWRARLTAIGKHPGLNPEALKRVVASPEALSILDVASRESLLLEMSNGSAEAEASYAKIREADRKAHRNLKAGR